MILYYKTFTNSILESNKFNPLVYNSFSELSNDDLKQIAKWGLINDFSTSGAWDDTDDIDVAIDNIVDGFKSLLNDDFPDGFKGIPNKMNIYRMIVLEDLSKLNKHNLGYSWFSNPNRIEMSDFRQQLWHLKTKNIYLITVEIKESQIDIPRTLFQRDMVWLENEIVLKDDTDLNLISIDKMS